jgi:hypothetical protein
MMKGVVHLSGNSPLMMQKMWVKGCFDEVGVIGKNEELFVWIMGYGGRRYHLSHLGGWGVVGSRPILDISCG